MRADHPASRTPLNRLTAWKFCCVGVPSRPLVPSTDDSVTSTNGTPRSTSLRASRHPWPNGLRP